MEEKTYRKKKGIAKPEYKNLTAFKAQEKNFKLYHGQKTDFSTLFEPENFVEVNGYQICELPFPSGAFYVRNFTSFDEVMEIGYFGLNHYCKRPYRTNLDSREELYQQPEENENKEEKELEEKTNEKQNENKTEETQKIMPNENVIKEQEDKTNHFSYSFNDKIRWANVGYQYDWTLRKYPDMKTPIHPTIQKLSDRANELYNEIEHIKKNYEPESAIINYYGPKDYMTGHLDDAEIDQESPIYSFSFGLSCIFLIGGRNKDEKPTAVRLNSGDLLIMAGESRKCYHGVPRILDNSFMKPEPEIHEQAMKHINSIENKEENIPVLNSFKQVENYFEGHRININIRQVFPHS